MRQPPDPHFHLDAIPELDPQEHFLHPLGSVQSPKSLLCQQQHFPDHRRGVVHLLVPLGRIGSQPQARKGRFHWVGGPQMPPVFLGEIVKGDHAVPVPFQGSRGSLVVAFLAPLEELLPMPFGLFQTLRVGDFL
jgi:hypothetical protein